MDLAVLLTLPGDALQQTSKALAKLDLHLPESASPGAAVEVVVAVTNFAAGHALPTSITELRQVWIDLTVEDSGGSAIFRSGAVDENGKLDPAAVVYTSVLHDAEGQVTYLPWRAAKLIKENLIGPKETRRESYAVDVPADAQGPLRVRAVLRYRSAPQDVLDELFGKGRLPIATVDMVATAGVLPLE